ncbi:MAG: sulfotransferase [Cyclobacteriaceae bacterium]|nr:sulfotransferase [Cyclobacteriaceae bacterium]
MYKEIQSRDYDRKPAWYRILNRTWESLYALGAEIDLSRDKLIRAARRSTGLKDFGKDFWEEPLDRMLDSIKGEAELNPIGKFITKKRLVNLLSIRLRSEWWFKKHPEILDQPLYPVYLIIGLQRTGTTKLQRLLSSDPEMRSLRSWEAINPAPLNNQVTESSRRIRQAEISEKALKMLSPNFFGIHPVEHLEPEEDILLLDVSFMSTTAEATMHVPSYASWLEKTDQSHAYAYAVKLLKFLQYQRPASKWVLKSPHHLEFLELTDKHLGEVHYLWTHRDIYECVPSFISMMIHSRAIFSDTVEPESVRDHWLRKDGYILGKAIQYRKSTKKVNSFTDIYYKKFMDDPVTTLMEIYRSIGPVDPDLEAVFRKLAVIDHRKRYGRHVYSMETFGITPEMIDAHTGQYQEFLRQLQNRDLEGNHL